MILVVSGLLVAIAMLLVFAGVVPSPFARVRIRVRRDGVVVEKGQLGLRARDHAADVLRAAGVTSGFITIGRDGRVTFSNEIPDELHQNLRNILLN